MMPVCRLGLVVFMKNTDKPTSNKREKKSKNLSRTTVENTVVKFTLWDVDVKYILINSPS